MVTRICFFLLVSVVLFAQPSTLQFNNGQTYSFQVFAGTPITFSDNFPTLLSDAPTNVAISVQDPWLSVGVLQGAQCDDSVLYAPQFIELNVTTDVTLCFAITSSLDPASPQYLPQGWYAPAFRVRFDGGAVLFPLRVQVVPTGYLHLTAGGVSVDQGTVAMDLKSGMTINAQILANSITETNPCPDQNTPCTVNYSYATKDEQTGQAAPWLVVKPNSNVITNSPPLTAFALSVDPSKIPAGATQLSGDFIVKSTGGTQDQSYVTLSIKNLPAPAFQLSANSLTFSTSAPQSQQFHVSSSTGEPIQFSIASNQPWLSVNPSGGQTPSDLLTSIDVSKVTANNQSGTLTISDTKNISQAVTVSVTAITAAACTYALTGTASLPAGGGSGSVTLTTGADCKWTPVSDGQWLRLVSVTPAAGTGTISFTFDANPGASRSCHISAGGQSFTLTQASGQSGLPGIDSFTANPASIDYGSSTVLSWQVDGATSLSLDHGVGNIPAASKTATVRPGATTSYTLTAQNDAGSQRATTTVTVKDQPPSGLKIITASPNPILTGDANTAETTISWSAPSSVKNVEIHTGAPDGPPVMAGGASGKFQTHRGLTDGTVYYLQDVSGGKPLLVANTLDTIAVRVVDPSKVFFAATPLYAPPKQNSGAMYLTWNAPSAAKVQVWVGSPRKQMSGDLSSSGGQFTPSWVSPDMVFSLQDASSGENVGSDANTLAVLQASLNPLQPAANLPTTFTADPNPIQLAAGQTTGTTTLNWNAPGHAKVVIFVNGPDSKKGTQMTGVSGTQGSQKTGNWVKNGMTFYLQDASGSSPEGSANTIATVTVVVKP